MTLDTNADGLYWATLPTQIASLTESALLGRVATIPTQTEYGAPPVNDSRVHLYDSAYLDPAGEFQLPSFVANGQSYQAHGKQVFYNQASTALYVVMEADSTSGLLNGFAVQIYPITNFLPCSPTLGSFSASVEATGTIGTVAVTAAPGCSYDASSDSAWTQLVSGYYGSGSGALTYIVRPNPGAARSGTITLGSQSLTVTQAAATVASTNFTELGYSVVAADYSKALDRVVIIINSPKELHIYDPIGRSDQIVPLPKTPLFLSVGPDGLSAAVGYDGWISLVNLSTGTITSTVQVLPTSKASFLRETVIFMALRRTFNTNLSRTMSRPEP